MKALVFHDIGDIRVEDVDEPTLQDPTDAIVRITTSALCGTDLHLIRGSMEGMAPGTILGHEGVGVVESIGSDVRNLRPGDRVVIASTIACGNCSYCRAGYHSQCDTANPNGKQAGTAFFGGPRSSGGFAGLQAEKARIPFANIGLVKLPDSISDDQAIMLSDIFPTGFFAAELAEIDDGDTVAVFGCGPVGQFAIASARMMGASRIFAIDRYPDRLDMARRQGAEVINFDDEDPVATILRLTGDIGVDRAIDAVGVDALGPQDPDSRHDFRQNGAADAWKPGSSPSQALEWSVKALAKAGTLAIVGVYADSSHSFPIGMAMNKNLTVKMGNCPHRRYIPELIELTASGRIDPAEILTHSVALDNAVDAFKAFDQRKMGWAKVALIASGQSDRRLDEPPTDEARNAELQHEVDDTVDDSFPASDPPSTYQCD